MNSAGQRANSNTALFLMELIIVIGFFSLVSVICVRLFVAASLSSKYSVNLNHTTRAMESLADAWTACGSDLSRLSAFYPDAAVELSDAGDPYTGMITVSYDKDWQAGSAAQNGEGFVLCLRAERVPASSVYGADTAGEAVTADISSVQCADGSVIGSLRVDHYLFLTGNAGEGVQ